MKLLVARLDQVEVLERLSASEQHALQRAEVTIAKGMKAFVAVGLALKEIRDRRLYRDRYGTFEEYCARRWELSRPRAYQLCAASEVVADLSTFVDSRVLPENEAQTRPLTRLKDPMEWRRAWHTAVKLASAENRPVTARDTEEAVQRLNGNDRIDFGSADGEPVYNCIQGDNADLIAAVARLYLPKGCRVADITYGRGVFWRKVNLDNYRFFKSDRITCPGALHDFRRLPYKNCLFDTVAFDPPYAHRGHRLQHGPRYAPANSSGGLFHGEILQSYRLGMAEATRILKPGGTLWVKCADEIERRVQRRSHMEVHEIARGLGLIDEDLFILMQQTLPIMDGRRQKHARKNCSFLWVFRKPRG
jgi:hypothetical protein